MINVYTAVLPSDLPPGTLKGNVIIINESGEEVPDISFPWDCLCIANTDGWKYSDILLLTWYDDHYTYERQVFPGNFRMHLYNGSFTSPDLPKKIVIRPDEVTTVDIILIYKGQNGTSIQP